MMLLALKISEFENSDVEDCMNECTIVDMEVASGMINDDVNWDVLVNLFDLVNL